MGSELVRQLVANNAVFFIDNNETAFFDLYEELKQKGFNIGGKIGDVRDRKVFDDIPIPDIIFHAAALKHVTPSEWTPLEYVKTNIFGTDNAIDFAQKCGAKLVNISTDKTVNAESIMGLTKKIAERMVKNAGFVSVRFGNVLGSRGSVIPTWQAQLDRNEPLTITDERMKRYFMSIGEACKLVIKAAKIGEAGQILILDMGELKSVKELALEILKKSGKESLGVKNIGIRPGETLEEKLMTDEEEKRAVKNGEFLII